MTTIDFSALHLVIDNESPALEILKVVFGESTDTFQFNDDYYRISKSITDNKYFWFYAKYGRKSPYSTTVINTINHNEEPNPRTKDQVEPDKQLFGLYCAEEKVFFLSNTKKKMLLELYFKSKLDKDVVIKTFYKDVDEFVKIIQKVDRIKFVAKSNLFSIDGEIMKIFPSPKDLYGLGMPDDFSLEANFPGVNKTDAFVEKLKKMVGWKDSCEADSLVCIGRDDKNFETIFNADSFTQKITITASKDQQGMHDEIIVRDSLMRRIKGD